MCSEQLPQETQIRGRDVQTISTSSQKEIRKDLFSSVAIHTLQLVLALPWQSDVRPYYNCAKKWRQRHRVWSCLRTDHRLRNTLFWMLTFYLGIWWKRKNSNEETSRRDALFCTVNLICLGVPVGKILPSNPLVKKKHWQQQQRKRSYLCKQWT